jgi:hypothetical protein
MVVDRGGHFGSLSFWPVSILISKLNGMDRRISSASDDAHSEHCPHANECHAAGLLSGLFSYEPRT